LARSLGAPLDNQGRVLVQPDLSVPGHPEISVIGDLAVLRLGGSEVPGVAQAAIQSGKQAGRNIVRTLRGEERAPFRYRNRGNAATIGRNKAIVDFGPIVLVGRAGWYFWLFLHILYLVGFRNRLSVLLEWAYAYFSYERGARLITRE
jgi:NADH dehydrogenase